MMRWAKHRGQRSFGCRGRWWAGKSRSSFLFLWKGICNCLWPSRLPGEGTVPSTSCVEQQRCHGKDREPQVSFCAELCDLSAVHSEVFPFHLAVQLEFWTPFLSGWSTGLSALHFPLVAEQGQLLVAHRAGQHWISHIILFGFFSQVCFFISVKMSWGLRTKGAWTECEKLEEQGCRSLGL